MKLIDAATALNHDYGDSLTRGRLLNILDEHRSELGLTVLETALIYTELGYINQDKSAWKALISKGKEIYMEALGESVYAKVLLPEIFDSGASPAQEVVVKLLKKDLEFELLPASAADTLKEVELEKGLDLTKLSSYLHQARTTYKNIAIAIRTDGIYSFALSQSAHPLLTEIVLKNGGETLKDAYVEIRSEPDLVDFVPIPVPVLSSGQPVSIRSFKVTPDLDALLALKEKTLGQLKVSLIKDGEEIASQVAPVQFGSYDSYPGSNYEGSIALFVTPNDSAVRNVIALTGKELEKLSSSSSLDDYQSGSKKEVFLQVKALYNVIHEEGIAYLTLPPSYENAGQKVRFPHDVLVHKQGNCLDLSILFCACLEAMGLHPFLVHVTGHAFVGVFLEDKTFPSPVYTDAGKVLEMNSEEKNGLLLIECTCVTAGNSYSFENALAMARTKTEDAFRKNDEWFRIDDIVRARKNGNLPLPVSYDDVGRISVDYKVCEMNREKLHRKDFSYAGDVYDLDSKGLGKFDVWEKKLLDLSTRNRLIEYSPSGKGLQLKAYDLDSLYQGVARDNKTYQLRFSEEVPSSSSFELPALTDAQYNEIHTDFLNGTIGYILRSQEQKTLLQTFDRERRKSYEETGSNILYLALGFLAYYPSEKAKKPAYAPLILVPVGLTRKSKDSYTLNGLGTQAFLNISILEFLRQEFGISTDALLAQDFFSDEDVSVNAVLNTVGEKLKPLARSGIVRTACLSTFNFAKAVLWSDVKFKRDELMKNRIVSSIVNQRFVLTEKDRLIEKYDENKCDPTSLALPLPADSSQLAAIQDAALGKSFILQGPPGTGKSQTITNMIVNAIYHGKTVLFVAEKMAALEVVQKRLNSLSLGHFALEAHSAKADRTNLMNQFAERLKLGVTEEDKKSYLETAEKIRSERKELNRVISLLHEPNGYFRSFYDCFTDVLSLDEKLPVIDIGEDYASALTEEDFEKSLRLFDRLQSETEANSSYLHNPFFLYRSKAYVPVVSKKNLREYLVPARKALSGFADVLDSFREENGIEFADTPKIVKAVNGILLFESEEKNVLPNWDKIPYGKKDAEYASFFQKALTYQEKAKKLASLFTPGIDSFDAEEQKEEYLEAQKKNAFFKMIAVKKLAKNLEVYFVDPKEKAEKRLEELYDFLISFRKEEQEVLEEIGKVPELLSPINAKEARAFDFLALKKAYGESKALYERIGDSLDKKVSSALLKKVKKGEIKKGKEFLESYMAFQKTEEEGASLGFDFRLMERYSWTYSRLLSSMNGMLLRTDYLQDWTELVKTVEECKDAGLTPFLLYAEEQESLASIKNIYRKSVDSYILSQNIAGDKEGSFSSLDLKNRLNDYRELFKKYQELTVQETAARVSGNLPSIDENSPASTEQGILNRAIKSRCRGKSVRTLFTEVKDILTRLFPVFLMSPMSCAQYLSWDMKKFDLVIFDEASQMPTSEAVGAIARGRSLVVVGDSKQMPPSSFFQNKGEEEDVDLDDQESILDDCEVISLPSHVLNWHYRSRHESLIRFSNAEFYGNRLVTFPSPNDRDFQISYVNAHGVYSARSAVNPLEAKAIVAEVKRRLDDPELSKKSIGIVAFSAAQQDQIEDELEDFFDQNRAYEKKAREGKEPLIVKNLENIQGDERDVILLSVCYGPDSSGRFYYRFGPLNGGGGERRLNVAITRAREEMVVFASFEPEDMNRMHSDSVGANELARFLKYAKYGEGAFTVPVGGALDLKRGFEVPLAQKLQERGYKVVPDVGKSNFRVDLAVIDPKNPENYLLGILCDSYSYESASTSLDRNIVQPNALRKLGWNLFRVWSFDYYDNPEKVIESIEKEIDRLEGGNGRKEEEIGDEADLGIELTSKKVEKKDYSRPYKSYTLGYGKNELESADELDADSMRIELVRNILETEAPISYDVLIARFASAVGKKHGGKLTQAQLADALVRLKASKNKNLSRTRTFLWKEGQIADLDYYRAGGDFVREIDDIPKEELFVAMKEGLENYGEMSLADLKRYVANAFQIKVLSRKADLTIEDAMNFYLNAGALRFSDDGSRIGLDEKVLKKKAE